MGWFSAGLLVVAASCLTLSAIHFHVWLRERSVPANGAFAVLAASVALLSIVELQMVRATTIEQFGRWLWWYHFPIWSGVVASVFFLRWYLGTGRAWLGWTVIGLRTAALVVNVLSSPNINYVELTGLDRTVVLGESLALGQGVTNPLLLIAQLSLVVLIAFSADAAWTAWRRGARRQAVTVGATMVLFVSAALLMAVLSYWGFARFPVLASYFFLPIVLFMGFELGGDIIRSVRLALELEAKTIALQDSEQKLAFAAEAAGAGLWSVDRRRGRLWATPRALSMFALAGDREHLGEEILATVHPDDRERVRAFINGSEAGALEYRVVLPDGATRWFGTRGAMKQGPRGADLLMGATIDITNRKQAEEETARQRIELEHLSRVATVTELSGALAHELNQPLAIILSNAEAAQLMLKSPSPDLAEVRAILDDIVDADERAGAVIRRLRGMLKRGAPQRQPVDLNEVVHTVLDFVRADLLRRGVTLEVQFGAGVRKVSADRVPIEQVVINLINNACDAMARNAPGDRVLAIETAEEGAMACVRVRDTGVGLPENPERVFEAFYTTKTEGLGMGLAISRTIVAAHGGRLSAEANRPRGAIFTVCLPVLAEPE